jgi:hypothetical protein
VHLAQQKKRRCKRYDSFSDHAIPLSIYYFREQEACCTGSDLTQPPAIDIGAATQRFDIGGPAISFASADLR